jgi:hypothetical protein
MMKLFVYMKGLFDGNMIPVGAYAYFATSGRSSSSAVHFNALVPKVCPEA